MRIGRLLVLENYAISSSGFVRGLTLVSSVFGFFVIVLLSIFCIFTLLSHIKTYIAFENETYERYILRFAIAVVLIFAPFGPFFILEPQWLPPRTIFPSIFGIALFLDTFICMISKVRPIKYAKSIVPVALIIPFFIIYIAEINNYKLLEEVDSIVIDNFLTTFYESGHSDDNIVVLFNTQTTIANVTTGGSPYRLENVTSNDWAMQGKANAISDTFRFTNIQPIHNNRAVSQESLDNGLLFGLNYDLSIIELRLQGNSLYSLIGNELFGQLNQDGDQIIFEKN
jgi:hypothetical protein